MLDVPTELLQAYLLPTLGLRDVVALRQTCAQLRALVTEAPDSSLRQAAQGLPAGHPVHSAASVGAFLAAQSRVARAVAAGPGAWTAASWDTVRCGPGTDVVVSPDSKCAAARKDEHLLLWEVPSWHQVIALPTPEHVVSSNFSPCFWSPCSELVGWTEGTDYKWRLCVYNISTGQLRKTEPIDGRVTGKQVPRFVAPEPTVAVCVREPLTAVPSLCTVLLPAEGEETVLVCPVEAEFHVRCAYAASSSGHLAFETSEREYVCVWRPGVSDRNLRWEGPALALQWSPDASMLAVVGSTLVELFTFEGKRRARLCKQQQLEALFAWSLSGLLIVCISSVRQQTQRMQLKKLGRTTDASSKPKFWTRVALECRVKVVLGPVLSPDLCFAASVVCHSTAFRLEIVNLPSCGSGRAGQTALGLHCVLESLPFCPASMPWISDGTGLCPSADRNVTLVRVLA